MLQGPRLAPLDPAERDALRAARRAAIRGAIALVLACGLVLVALGGSLLQRDPVGVLPLVALLGAGWVWWLRHMPRRALAIGRDLRRGEARVVSGQVRLRQRRGIGLLAPTHREMLLNGLRYGLSLEQADRLHDGMAVHARLGPESGVPASIVPASLVSASVVPAPASPPAEPGVAIDPGAAGAQGLTAREVELLRLIASGRTDKGIARELGLEPATVRTYNSQLYAKLGVRRRTEAAARAHALGLLTNVGN